MHPDDNRNQYMHFIINNKPTCALVDTGSIHNFMTETATKRLELKLASAHSCVNTVHTKTQNAHGVAYGVGVKIRQSERYDKLYLPNSGYVVLGHNFRLCS